LPLEADLFSEGIEFKISHIWDEAGLVERIAGSSEGSHLQLGKQTQLA
jgi:hypothetical protein